MFFFNITELIESIAYINTKLSYQQLKWLCIICTLHLSAFFYFWNHSTWEAIVKHESTKMRSTFLRVNFPYTACILMNFPKRIIANFRARCCASAYSLRKNYNDAVGNNSSFPLCANTNSLQRQLKIENRVDIVWPRELGFLAMIKIISNLRSGDMHVAITIA